MPTTYTSVRNGRWFDPDTWSPRGIPGYEEGDSVVIYHRITIDAPTTYLQRLSGIRFRGEYPQLVFTNLLSNPAIDINYILNILANHGDNYFGFGIDIDYSHIVRQPEGTSHTFILVESTIHTSAVGVSLIFHIYLEHLYALHLPTYDYGGRAFLGCTLVEAGVNNLDRYTNGGRFARIFQCRGRASLALYAKVYGTERFSKVESETILPEHSVITFPRIVASHHSSSVISREMVRTNAAARIFSSGLSISSINAVDLQAFRSVDQMIYSSSSPLSMQLLVPLSFQARNNYVSAGTIQEKCVGAFPRDTSPVVYEQTINGEDEALLWYVYTPHQMEVSSISHNRVEGSINVVTYREQEIEYSSNAEPTLQCGVPESTSTNYSEKVIPYFLAATVQEISYTTDSEIYPTWMKEQDDNPTTSDLVEIQRSMLVLQQTEDVAYDEMLATDYVLKSFFPLTTANIITLQPLRYVTDAETFIVDIDKVIFTYTKLEGNEKLISDSPLHFNEKVIFLNTVLTAYDYIESSTIGNITQGWVISEAALSPLVFKEKVEGAQSITSISGTAEMSTADMLSFVKYTHSVTVDNVGISFLSQVLVGKTKVNTCAHYINLEEHVIEDISLLHE